MESKEKAHIEIDHLYKSYKLKDRNNKQVTVLDDISFQITEGEKVGIIGRNGAGKSTLLNIISGFSSADKGRINIQGKVSPLLDIGTNLKEELSGKENVETTGQLMGYNQQRIENLLSDIEEFVDIGSYWLMPVKTYSSGMKARVAFAQCAFIIPEILIIDEVLGVGDIDFVQKSQKKIIELCEKGKILLLVSHSSQVIANMTQRCIWLEKGRIVEDGETSLVTRKYDTFIAELEKKSLLEDIEQRRYNIEKKDISAYIESIILKNESTESVYFEVGERCIIDCKIFAKKNIRKYKLSLEVQDIKGNIFIEDFVTLADLIENEKENNVEIEADIGAIHFSEGIYFAIINLITTENTTIDTMQLQFNIKDSKREYYSFPLGYTQSEWEIKFEGERITNEHIWSNSTNL